MVDFLVEVDIVVRAAARSLAVLKPSSLDADWFPEKDSVAFILFFNLMR